MTVRVYVPDNRAVFGLDCVGDPTAGLPMVAYQWLAEQGIPYDIHVDYYERIGQLFVSFDREEHAMLFKLTWC